MVPLDALAAYAKAVLEGLTRNRDVKSDDAGMALCRFGPLGVSAECTWQMFEVDFSGIGMATDMPLVVYSYADADEIEWHFGATPIATTPRSHPPEAAANSLDTAVLLDGFRRFVLAESVLFPTTLTKDAGKNKGPLAVDPDDCACAECGGSLEVTDVDDVTMSVECENGHAYELEHDAFDEGFDYVLEFLSRRDLGRE